MKELNRTDRLTIATVIFAIILVIGLITLKKPEIPYSLTVDEMAGVVISSTETITPGEVIAIVEQGNDNFLLVDVRNPVDYQKSHIRQSVNIPIHEILEKQNLKTFSDHAEGNKTVILYGQDQLQANGAWMVLKQTGFDNVRVLLGGFEYYDQTSTGMPGSATSAYMAEKPVADYKAILESLGSTTASSETKAPEPVKIIKKEKKSAAEGGC